MMSWWQKLTGWLLSNDTHKAKLDLCDEIIAACQSMAAAMPKERWRVVPTHSATDERWVHLSTGCHVYRYSNHKHYPNWDVSTIWKLSPKQLASLGRDLQLLGEHLANKESK